MSRFRWSLRNGALLAAAMLMAACDGNALRSPDIAFAPTEDTALKDPDNPARVFRVDLARVEYEFPLARAERMKITPENLAVLSQEQIDQIYGRLTAGPIPNGLYHGDFFFARGDNRKTRIDEIFGGIEGRLAGASIELVERLGGLIWKGKMFYRDQRVVRNLIEDLGPIEALIDDRSTIMTADVARRGWLSAIRPKHSVWLLFPAKLYCGQSLLDARRESIIIDYNYNDEIEGYRASPDSINGRNGFKVRDELRMIRPGLYLARAYVNRFFFVNFTMYDPEVANRESAGFAAGQPITEDCWPGEQVRKTASR